MMERCSQAAKDFSPSYIYALLLNIDLLISLHLIFAHCYIICAERPIVLLDEWKTTNVHD